MTDTTGQRLHAIAGETSDRYRWIVLAVTSVGALLAALTSGTLVIALPDILRDLHTDLFTLMWIVVGYTLAATVLVLNAGRIADQVGRARSYTAGFALFTLASAACALAPTAFLLIVARLVQGVGGAFLMANSAALVTDAFPRRELGRALGINAMVVGAGLILGPILGGWLTTYGWPMVFWFNLPIGIIGTLAAATLLVEQGRHTERAGFDIAGSVLYLVGLSGLVSALAFGGIYGWTTPWVIAGFAAFVIAAPAFLWVESRHPAPLPPGTRRFVPKRRCRRCPGYRLQAGARHSQRPGGRRRSRAPRRPRPRLSGPSRSGTSQDCSTASPATACSSCWSSTSRARAATTR